MKLYRGLVVAPLLVLLTGLAANLAAQTPAAAPSRVGYINVAVALRSMPGFAQAESTFTKEFQTVEAELQSIQASLDSAGAAFEQQSPMLSPTNRTAKRREIEQQQEKAQQRVAELRQKVTTLERELMQPMQERLTAIIDGIRAEGNFSMIFDVGSDVAAGLIVSVDRSLDITQKVVQRLQQTSGG